MDSHDLLHKKIENYKILDILGSGGMGTVYKAFDYELQRKVAIKFLSIDLLREPHFRERFKKEAIHQAHLSHPNIAIVHRLVEYNGKTGIVIEYIRGNSLSNILKRNKLLSLNDSVYIVKQVLAGVGYAHAKGFIHRDVKPSNIMLNNEGQIKILDFGLSKNLEEATQTNSPGIMGTYSYMSPEQVMNRPVSHQSDIYSIGCTFYEMLAGFPPFAVGSEYEIMDAQVRLVHRKLREVGVSVPESIDRIIDKALAKDPLNRYLSCEDFMYDLRDAERLSRFINLDSASEEIKPPQGGSKFKSFVVILIIIIFLILVLFFSFNYIELLMKGKPIKIGNHSELIVSTDGENSDFT